MNNTIRKDFVDTFNKLTHKLSPWEVWKDFVVMCSCSFSNALDKSHYDEREKCTWIRLGSIQKRKPA